MFSEHPFLNTQEQEKELFGPTDQKVLVWPTVVSWVKCQKAFDSFSRVLKLQALRIESLRKDDS